VSEAAPAFAGGSAGAQPDAGGPPSGTRPSLSGRSSLTLPERGIEWGLAAAGLVSVGITAGIIAVLAMQAGGFFSAVPLRRFLLETEWTPLFAEPRYGIWPLVAGTLLTTGIAMALALPLGLLSAVYLSELASPRARRVLKPLLELLAGVPTLVYGWFALVALTPLLQRIVPDLSGFNALSAGLAMGVMVLPIVASLSEDALRAVPRTLREAALALGAGPLPALLRVTVPAARSGIAAATLLAVARALGETMIVAIAAGQQPRLTLDPRVPIETMTAFIVQVSLGDTPRDTPEYRSLFAVGAALFVLCFGLHALAHRLLRGRGAHA
jgi:phosphate transport system permease protein